MPKERLVTRMCSRHRGTSGAKGLLFDTTSGSTRPSEIQMGSKVVMSEKRSSVYLVRLSAVLLEI